MVKGKGNYQIYQYIGDKWYAMAEDLKLPPEIKLQKNTPYRLKIMVENGYISFYMNDILLIKLFDSFSTHKGKVGLYAQGGKTGATTIAFDEFRAKKNSLFQKDK